jgi:hypothetical protein
MVNSGGGAGEFALSSFNGVVNSNFQRAHDLMLTIQRRQTRSSVVLSMVLIWSTISGEF